jgi:hypothetical protein
MSEVMTLFGGPMDGQSINYRGGWKVTILTNVDYQNNWLGEFFFDDYVLLSPNLKVMAWMGAHDEE